MLHQHILQRSAGDVFAATDDVLGTILDLYGAIGMPHRQVLRVQYPVFKQLRGGNGVLVIAASADVAGEYDLRRRRRIV